MKMSVSIELLRVLVIWALIMIGMILHFNYHVSKIFYGIDVARPGADGTINPMVHVVRTAFYHLPMIFIVALLFLRSQIFRLVMFLITFLYTISHIMHVWKELTKPTPDFSQVVLMTLILVMSIVLNVSSWKHYLSGRNVEQA